ncbi:hypothetical protein HAX54_050927, partial [Datura stramonium]|nr:hypothetical protein [Datura stramonium]
VGWEVVGFTGIWREKKRKIEERVVAGCFPAGWWCGGMEKMEKKGEGFTMASGLAAMTAGGGEDGAGALGGDCFWWISGGKREDDSEGRWIRDADEVRRWPCGKDEGDERRRDCWWRLWQPEKKEREGGGRRL